MVGGDDRGDHGFLDVPTRLFCLDGDGIKMPWRADPEGAIRRILSELGEPWTSASCVWFFSSKHGLEFIEETGPDDKKHKRWTGRVVDGLMYVRIAFLTDRPLNEAEASALTRIAQAHGLKVDESIARWCSPITSGGRAGWSTPTATYSAIFRPSAGSRERRTTLAVPEDLTTRAHWAKAQGHSVDVADHPDAESAVRGIGSDGRVRQHLKARSCTCCAPTRFRTCDSFADHSLNIVARLQAMIEQHHEKIAGNLVSHGRRWSEVHGYLAEMPD